VLQVVEGGEPFSSQVDFATFTVSSEVGEALLAVTTALEPGFGRVGFKSSELRSSTGGQVWRRSDPVNASKRWGKSYESWECDGSAADWLAQWLVGKDVKPTRLDTAWDFTVSEALKTGQVVRAFKDHARERGLNIGASGQGGIYTRYVGSANSDARLRIYRKDLQDAAYLIQFGPVMRVELVLRRAMAEAIWPLMGDRRAFYAAAAGHVFRMTGRSVQLEVDPCPPVAPEVAADAAQMVLSFMKQNSSTLGLIQDLGLDVHQLASLMRTTWSRMTEHRHEQRRRRLRMVKAADVETLVRREVLRRRKGRGA
jgi:hypothetical protein